MIHPVLERHLKTIIYAGAGLWIALVGWLQLDAVIGPTTLQFRALDAQFERCDGQFSKRYDCKSAILLSSGHTIFFSWSGTLAIILLPPALMVGGLALYNRKRKEAAAVDAKKRALARRAMTGMSRIDELQMEAETYKSDEPVIAEAASEQPPPEESEHLPPEENEPQEAIVAPSGGDGKVSAEDVRRALFGQ